MVVGAVAEKLGSNIFVALPGVVVGAEAVDEVPNASKFAWKEGAAAVVDDCEGAGVGAEKSSRSATGAGAARTGAGGGGGAGRRGGAGAEVFVPGMSTAVATTCPTGACCCDGPSSGP